MASNLMNERGIRVSLSTVALLLASCSAPGTPGVSCWDLDQDGECDPDSEDLNHDGSCSVSDCAPLAYSGTITGVVESEIGGGIEGATLTFLPGETIAVTRADGGFAVTLPIGVYELTASAQGFHPTIVSSVPVVALETTLLAPIVLIGSGTLLADAGEDQRQVGFGATVTVNGSGEGGDADLLTYSWSQISGAPVAISDVDMPTASITLPTLAAALAAVERELPDRTGIFSISPRIQGEVTLELTVSDGAFSATDTVTITAAEPTGASPVVPLGVNVYFVAAEAASYSWSLVAPTGSASALDGADTRTTSFVPDVAGTYRTSLDGGETIEVTTGNWQGIVGNTADCQACHNDSVAPDNFILWADTPMGKVCSNLLDGSMGPYEQDCLACHTLGYSTVADNGGFDDVATSQGWAFPSALEAGNWQELLSSSPQVAQMANVQCESCHGPQVSELHMLGVRARVGTGACGQCHDSRSHTVRPYEWERSTHADLVMARAVSTVEVEGARAGDCGRCHSAQGFIAFVDNLLEGDAGPIAGGVAELSALGLQDSEVEPITCAACHDPHTATSPHQLRLYDTIEMLPAGFGVEGAGSGAICAACHNSGRGRHDDSHLPTNYETPEVSAQVEILYARNAYFVSLGGVGATNHAAVGDSCATCHMEPTTEHDYVVDYPSEGGHTWRVREDHCGRCHDESVNGRAIQAIAEENLALVAEEITAELISELASAGSYNLRAWDPATGCYSSSSGSNVTIDGPPASASIERIDREMGFSITLPSSRSVTWASDGCSGSDDISTIYFQLSSLESEGTELIPSSDVLVRALWNFELLHGDGSLGLHNPSWVLDVIGATYEALQAR